MLNDLVEFLQSNNLKISGEDLADAIWLARQMQDADATPDEGDAPETTTLMARTRMDILKIPSRLKLSRVKCIFTLNQKRGESART